MSQSKSITVTLGEMQERVEERVRSGSYATVGDVLQAGLRALDREEAAIDGALRRSVEAALADPRPAIPAADVFAELRRHHAERMRVTRRDP